MASVNKSLSPLTTGETMRDYKHASRTFVDNNFELQPRHSNLFHVVFNFTPDAATLFNTVDKLEIPILVKSIDLPTYTVDVQTHNQYNRKVQSHHSMNYNPITAVFHDDVKELIRNLWHKYYIFYNADPTYDLDSNSYTPYDKYSNRVQQQWGMQRGNKRFFKDIKIYSMHNHKFAEYTLINPIITGFNHDNHAHANPSLMQSTMQFSYETVKYATGYVNDITPTGFADIHYDVERSDIDAENAENSAFINGELKSVNGQRSKDLFQGNVIGVIKDADIIFNQSKPITSGSILQDTLAIFANNLLTGQKPTSNILVPVTGAVERSTSGIANTITDNIVTSVTGTASSLFGLQQDKVSSQNQSIGSTKFYDPQSNTYQIGYGKTLPTMQGSAASANKISSTTKVNSSSTIANTKGQKISELQSRLNNPNIPDGERAYLQEQIRLRNL